MEFLTQWSRSPQLSWLNYIFKVEGEEGLGLTCPVIMVHGNHEGFENLARIVPSEFPKSPVAMRELPAVDTAGHIRFLPPGWQTISPSDYIVGVVGGIEEGQRTAKYHLMAYLDEAAILNLEDKQLDIMVTHQGPSAIQGRRGSENLQVLLDAGVARAWFHGHSITSPEPVHAGPDECCLVVPLDDLAFPDHGMDTDEPGKDGWAIVELAHEKLLVQKKTPPLLREFRRHKWAATSEGLLICPPLADVARGSWKGKQGASISRST